MKSIKRQILLSSPVTFHENIFPTLYTLDLIIRNDKALTYKDEQGGFLRQESFRSVNRENNTLTPTQSINSL